MNEDVARVLASLGILGRRGNDFATAEDAVPDALLEAHRSWGDGPPDDAKGRSPPARARNTAERDYLTRRAARLRHR